MKSVPQWAEDLYQGIEGETSSLFILHHNTADYVRLDGEFLSLSVFLGRSLGGISSVIFYNRSTGLRFPDGETEHRFREGAGLKGRDPQDTYHEEQRRRALMALGEGASVEPPIPTHPSKVVPLVAQALRSGRLRDGGRCPIVVLEYAETIAPAADISCMNEDDRTTLVALLSLATDRSVQECGGVVVLIVGNLADLHPALRQPGGGVEVVEIPLPDERGRLEYIEHLLDHNGFKLSMSTEALARATAGLT
ncbi:MAG: hypothetical protein ACE5K9_10725, partial [Candidatus Methylomirabilales bacterium]